MNEAWLFDEHAAIAACLKIGPQRILQALYAIGASTTTCTGGSTGTTGGRGTWGIGRRSNRRLKSSDTSRFASGVFIKLTNCAGTTYASTITDGTGGSVSFTIASAVANTPLTGWNEKIFADVGCTGTLQAGAAVLYPPAVPTTVVAGQQVCIVMQELIPATAQNAYTDTVKVQADFTFSNAAPGLSATYQVTDVTTVGSNALDLKKQVRNVTQNGVFGLSNQAKSGETLEYRITYTNNGAAPISALSINNTTPAYSSFVSGLLDTTPATLTACAKTTPANALPAATVDCTAAQAAGGTGALAWNFTGSLAPGGTGGVLFQVKVN